MNPAIAELIPHRPPFLFVDDIVSASATGLVARRTWRPDEDFYRGHYPGAPITPGVLLCEAVFQAGALFLARARGGGTGVAGAAGMPLLARICDVRFRNPVFPGETITIEVEQTGVPGRFHHDGGHGDQRREARAQRWILPSPGRRRKPRP